MTRRSLAPVSGAPKQMVSARLSEQFRRLAGAMRNQLRMSEPKSWPAGSLDSAVRELYELHVRPVGHIERPIG